MVVSLAVGVEAVWSQQMARVDIDKLIHSSKMLATSTLGRRGLMVQKFVCTCGGLLNQMAMVSIESPIPVHILSRISPKDSVLEIV